MPYWLRISRRAATLVAWAIAVLDALPWGPQLPDHAFLLVVALACVGTYAWITYNSARPVDEVYLAGKAMGRREVELERDAGDRVVRMTERRLTVVGGD
jgi:hypothetical protein